MHRPVAVAAALLVAAAAVPSHAAPAAAGVTVAVSKGKAVLGNDRIQRTWSINGGHAVTSSLLDVRTGHEWSAPGSVDFTITENGLTTSSTNGWTLATIDRAPQGLTLHYVSTTGEKLDRAVVLHPDSAVLETTSTFTAGLAPSRVSAYTLDDVRLPTTTSTEVQTYHGGSDWRDDYRKTATLKGAFDVEGEVARTDDGHGRGVFLVSERRSGVASRTSRDAAGQSAVGVDFARDAFDFGPLKTDAPDYNRFDNPAYPVPARSRTVLPGATLRLGRGFTGVYSGGAAEAGVAFTQDFAANVTPAYARTVGLNSFHPWSHGSGMSDANLRTQALLAKKLGVESFMLDDQWQGGAGGESGDWHFDPARFPDKDNDGVPDFVTFLHAQGMKLGLWMSLAEFNQDSTTYKAHPDWVCAPTGIVTSQVADDAGLGVWDLTNPALQSYLTSVVDRLIKAYDVREIKLDFQSWTDCGSHDYLDYEDAFIGLVRSLEAKHPGVAFELDETNDQRAWPFESAALGASWFDNGHLHGSTAQAKELHDLWVASPWLPTSSIGYGFLDGTLEKSYTAGYLAPMGILGHLTYWTDQAKIPASARPELSWWADWYTHHRGDLSGASYELTSRDPLDGASPMVLEPWNGDHGLLFAFFQSSTAPVAVHVYGVKATTHYRLTDIRTGKVLMTATGSKLAHLTLSGTAYSAQVLSVTPVS